MTRDTNVTRTETRRQYSTNNASGSRGKTRVLHILGSLNREGIQSYLLRMLELYDHSRFQMDLCCRGRVPSETAAQAESAGARILRCKASRFIIPAAMRFRRLFREHPYDVVVDHYPIHGWPAMWAAKATGIPVRLGVLHSTMAYNTNTLVTRTSQRIGQSMSRTLCTGICGVSQNVLDIQFPNWQSESNFFRLVYLGVDVERFSTPFSRDDLRDSLSIPRQAYVVGHVGGFRKPKNHFFLVDAFTRFLCDRPEGYLLLVGDGDLRADVEEYVRRKGIQDRVIFAGTRHDVERLYAAMDLFFFPSLREGFGLVVAEASIVGVPVACSGHPAIAEGLHPEVRADCVVDIDSVEQTAAKLLHLSFNTALCERIVRLNRERVLDMFSLQKSVNEFEHLFSQGATDRTASLPSTAISGGK